MNAGIAVAISYPSGFGILGAVIIFFGMEVLYLAFRFRDALFRYLVWRLFERERTERRVLKLLMDSRFPRPDDYVYDVQGYLEKTAGDKEIDADTRVVAAAMIAQLTTLRLAGGVLWTAWVEATWERALEKYSDTFPPSDSSDEAHEL